MKFSCFFTLTELLFITVIICILASILLPAASSTVNRAKLAACSNHLRQIGTATIIYAQDNTGLIPNIMPGMEKNSIPIIRLPNRTFLALGRLLKAVYIPDIKIFGCPDSPGCEPQEISINFQKTPMLWIAYLYRSQDCGFDPVLSSPNNQNRAYVTDFACITNEGRIFAPHNLSYNNILYADGHCESRTNSPAPFEYFTVQAARHGEMTPDCTSVWQSTDE